MLRGPPHLVDASSHGRFSSWGEHEKECSRESLTVWRGFISTHRRSLTQLGLVGKKKNRKNKTPSMLVKFQCWKRQPPPTKTPLHAGGSRRGSVDWAWRREQVWERGTYPFPKNPRTRRLCGAALATCSCSVFSCGRMRPPAQPNFVIVIAHFLRLRLAPAQHSPHSPPSRFPTFHFSTPRRPCPPRRRRQGQIPLSVVSCAGCCH